MTSMDGKNKPTFCSAAISEVGTWLEVSSLTRWRLKSKTSEFIVTSPHSVSTLGERELAKKIEMLDIMLISTFH